MLFIGLLNTMVRQTLSPPKTIPRIVDAGDFFCVERRVRGLTGFDKIRTYFGRRRRSAGLVSKL